MKPRMGIKYVKPDGSLTIEGVQALGGTVTAGVGGFTVDSDGHLLYITADGAATLSIDDDGHLILEV